MTFSWCMPLLSLLGLRLLSLVQPTSLRWYPMTHLLFLIMPFSLVPIWLSLPLLILLVPLRDLRYLLSLILEPRASCHLSPFLSDFKYIQPIKPHPIKGLGRHSISALGVDLIELQTPLSILSLCDALYVPSSEVRLLSIFRLGEAGFTAHFYPRDGHCFVSDSTNTIVARGSALSDRGLFVLSSFKVPIHSHSSFSPSAYFSSRLPDVDSWHKHLGHCGPNAVIDMAHSQAVKGMRVSVSLPPPKCPHCILGK